MEISELQLQEKIVGGGRFLVDFFATWCGPCRMFAPIYEKAAETAAIPFVKVDVDKCEYLTEQYGIHSVPTIMLFDKGQAVKTHSGTFANVSEIAQFICL